MSYVGVDNVRFLSVAGHFHRTLFAAIAALASASHFKAMTTDPGAVPPDAKPLPEQREEDNNNNQPNGEGALEDPLSTGAAGSALSAGGSDAQNSASQQVPLMKPLPQQPQQRSLRLCRRCKAFKPQRAHHCSVCGRCIIKMDHHCPWVNNCVGIGNHKYFLLFVFYTFLSCIYAISLIVFRFMTCMGRHNEKGRHISCLDRPSDLLPILGLLIESLLFGMFTSCMMLDQHDVIHTKLTHIDRLKGTNIVGTLAGITEVFGTGKARANDADTDSYAKFRPDWLSPFANVCFPEPLQDEVMGFCRPIVAAASVCSKKVRQNGAATTTTESATADAPTTGSSQPKKIADIV